MPSCWTRFRYLALVFVALTLLSCTTKPTPVPRPSPTPAPTIAPLPPQSPVVVSRGPQRGQEQAPLDPVVLTFDQPMDQRSVEAAFAVSPAVQGSFHWDKNRLTFLPSGDGFARATRYRVTLDKQARSAAGLALQDDFVFDFRTQGYLEVVSIVPAQDAGDVPIDSALTVVFNRPVVPLTDIQGQSGLALHQLLVIDPEVPGTGQWLNTSTYVFRPSPNLLPGTTYQVTVHPALIQSVSDAVLQSPYRWTFRTAFPQVVSFNAGDSFSVIGPYPTITVTFNMPMDSASVKRLVTLETTRIRTVVTCSYRVSGSTVALSPVAALPPQTDFVVRVSKGAVAAAGGPGTTEEVTWAFRTFELPGIVSTRPADGSLTADPGTALRIQFSSPMNRESVMSNLTITPAPDEVDKYWSDSDMQLTLSFGAQPSRTYSFEIGADARGRYGHRLGQTTRVTFTTRALEPSLWSTLDRVSAFNAYTTTVMAVQHVNVPRIDLRLYRLTRADFLLLNSDDWWQRWRDFRPESTRLLRSWQVVPDNRLNQTATTRLPLSTDGVSALAPGFYYLEVSAPGVQSTARQLLVVSHAAVTLKASSTEALVWVTDLQSGLPLPGVDVALFGPNQVVLGTGRTDNQGVFFTTLQNTAAMNAWSTILAFAGSMDASAFASTELTEGISPWQFDLPYEYGPDPYRVHLYTDRAIYRPAQTVYFKAVVRSDDDGHYGLPAAAHSAIAVITDNQGKEVYRGKLELNDLGTAAGQIDLAAEASLGDYSLSLELDGRAYGTGFTVAEYRKPEYVVSVTTSQQEYTQGDRITATVQSSYYFGGPVAGATVTWRVLSQDYYFSYSGSDDYSFVDVDWETRGRQTMYGTAVTSGQGVTDASGQFSFSLPADVAAYRNSQLWTLEASIVDASNQEVSSRTSAVVHKGLVYVGIRPELYLSTAGQESKLRLITVDRASAPVPGVPVTIVLLQLNWYNVQVESKDEGFYWEWQLRETPVATTTVTSGADGRAVAAVTPLKGGSYRVRAFARDSRGNEVRSSAYLWVSARDYVSWRQENNDRIELVLDKKAYAPGDTARLLIPSPFQGNVAALLTIERGHILQHRVLQLGSNSEQVEIPILPDYAPNVFVSVVLVKGSDATNPLPSYRVGYITLPVSTVQKQLTLKVTPDRTEAYRPGQQASFDIVATDYAGQPVQAEFSLQLVDAAVLALSEGWQGTLLGTFYGTRSLGVRTGSSLSISAERRLEQTTPPSGKGGSGRGDLGTDVVRKNLLDTAYWNAQVRTDVAGRAHATVDLPDNLTTWRVTAKGLTASTLVGEQSIDIITNKPLMVRAVAPRFFVVGDKAQLGAIVHNATSAALEAEVSLQCPTLDFQQPSQRVRVEAGGSATVFWTVQVRAVGSAVITWRAASGGLSDGLELTLPVYPYSAPEVVATAGQVPAGEARVETVILPDVLDASQGELTLQLDPSLAASMKDGLTYLETYPYDCIEQTVSRFLPNVLTYRALRELGIANQDLEARLPQYVGVGLQRLYALQHYDGGWGWWLSDDSQPFLSAYTLLGMYQARQAGFSVDSSALDRASAYLVGALDSDELTIKYSANARAFVLYVLGVVGKGDLGRTVALYDQRAALSTYGKAYLILALRNLQPNDNSRVTTLVTEIKNVAILSATGAHWEELELDYWTMSTDTRSTALVLMALLKADPTDPLLPNVVRWLMAARREGHWETTQETAWSVMALTDFMVSTGELEADYGYRVGLNTRLLGQGVVTAQDVGATRKLVVDVGGLLREEANRIVIDRSIAQAPQTGKGQLYYSLSLRYFLPADQVQELDRGIFVQREYSLLERPKVSVASAAVGDVIQVKLTIIAPNSLHYVVVEDPLPAGCEALDPSLKTTSAQYLDPGLVGEDGRMPPWWYFVHSEVRDEKVALFATYLPAGTYQYTYLMRASLAGSFLTMPATAFEMYFPEVMGRSNGLLFNIQ